MHVATADIGTAAHDRLTVTLNNASGTQLARLGAFFQSGCQYRHAPRVRPQALPRQTITIVLEGSNDAILPTARSIDNVFVEAVPWATRTLRDAWRLRNRCRGFRPGHVTQSAAEGRVCSW